MFALWVIPLEIFEKQRWAYGQQKWDALALIKGSISVGSVDLSTEMGTGIVKWQRPRMRTRSGFFFLIFIILTLSESA